MGQNTPKTLHKMQIEPESLFIAVCYHSFSKNIIAGSEKSRKNGLNN